MLGDIFFFFLLSKLGEGCYQHQVDRVQVHCQIFYRAWDSHAQQGIVWSKTFVVLRLRNSCWTVVPLQVLSFPFCYNLSLLFWCFPVMWLVLYLLLFISFRIHCPSYIWELIPFTNLKISSSIFTSNIPSSLLSLFSLSVLLDFILDLCFPFSKCINRSHFPSLYKLCCIWVISSHIFPVHGCFFLLSAVCFWMCPLIFNFFYFLYL